jgi:hypothetical protein
MFEQWQRESFRLVGNHPERQAQGLEGFEAFAYAGEKDGMASVGHRVVVPETVQRFLGRRCGVVGGNHAAGENALDQIGDAAPDVAANRRHGNFRAAEVAEHGVGCGVQVEDGVDQRTVEVEEHGTHGE